MLDTKKTRTDQPRQTRQRRRAGAIAARAGPTTPTFESSGLRTSLVWLVCARLALVLLWLSTEGLDGFQPPKELVGRVLDVAIAACLVIALYRFGLQIVPRTRLHLLVAGYLAAVSAATLFASDRYAALYGDAVAFEGWVFTIEMAVLLIAVAVAFRSCDDWRALAATVGGATLLLVAYAGIQALGLDPLILKAGERTVATLGQPEFLSVWLAIALGAVAGVLVVARDRRVLIATAVGIVVLVLAGGTTGTRGFLLSLVGAGLAPFVVLVRLGRLPRTRVLVGGILALAVVASLLLFATPVGSRALGTLAGAEPVRDRALLYREAWEAFLDRPVLGWGPGSFEAAATPHRSLELMRIFGPLLYYTNAHDLFIEAFVTTGALGGLALLAIFVAFAAKLVMTGLDRHPLVASALFVGLTAYLVQALVSVGSLSVDWYPWLVFGATAALADPRDTPAAQIRHVDPRLAIAAVGAVAVLAAMASWPAYAANDHAGLAKRAGERGEHGAAIEAAARAVALDPGKTAYLARLGVSLGAAQRHREAADAFAQATEREPHHAEFWNNLATGRLLQATVGDMSSGGLAAALSAAQRGLSHDPLYTPLLYTEALIYLSAGDNDHAADSAALAIRLYAKDDQYDVVLRDAAAKASPQVALAVTRRALEAKDSVNLRIAAALAAIRSGDRESAMMHLRRALELDPANALARDLLGGL